MKTLVAAGVVLTVITSGSSLAAGPSPRSDTTPTVTIYATVTDANGRWVSGLTADDFEISDNGSTRRPATLEKNSAPMTLVVMADRSPSVQPLEGAIRTALGSFLDRLLPGDRTAVGSFGHTVALVPSFAADRAALLDRLDAPIPFPAGTALWDAIDAARAALSPQPGKRVIVVFTDADDNCSVVDMDVLRANLGREGVMLYALGPGGAGAGRIRDLRAIAEATGGAYVQVPRGADLGTAAARVADELHTQYALRFTANKLDGRIHRITVRVHRPGMVARTKRFYVASDDAAFR